MPTPSFSEQAAIVRYLDRATEEIDAATHRLRRLVTLAHEYLRSLIGEVIAGKIDVRNKAAELSYGLIDVPRNVVDSAGYHTASSGISNTSVD